MPTCETKDKQQVLNHLETAAFDSSAINNFKKITTQVANEKTITQVINNDDLALPSQEANLTFNQNYKGGNRELIYIIHNQELVITKLAMLEKFIPKASCLVEEILNDLVHYGICSFNLNQEQYAIFTNDKLLEYIKVSCNNDVSYIVEFIKGYQIRSEI